MITNHAVEFFSYFVHSPPEPIRHVNIIVPFLGSTEFNINSINNTPTSSQLPTECIVNNSNGKGKQKLRWSAAKKY